METLSKSLRFQKKGKFEASKLFNILNMRSYKTVSMICDPMNFRFIYRANTEMVDTFCKFFPYKHSYFCFPVLYLSSFLQRPEGICNMNHVAKLTEYFLKKEQDISMNLMITYNIAFIFMTYLDFPLMQNFFVFLIGNMYHHSYLNVKNQTRLWKYLAISNFFIDFANLMLYPSIDKFPIEKMKDSWHPYDVSPFIVQKELKNELALDHKKDEADQHLVALFEEYTGFRTDIDRVKSLLLSKGSL